VVHFHLRRISLSLSIAALALFFAAQPARATLIQYEVTPLGGSAWSVQYYVFGHAFSTNEFLAIYFPYTAYSSDLADNTPADANWFTQVIVPDPLLLVPQDGEFDALPLVNGAPPAAFAVSFTYLGVGAPGAQDWALIDSNDFVTVLDSGQTTAPEPSTFAMFAGALFVAMFLRHRTQRTPSPPSR
jgi:hypothetical protein